MPKPRTAADLRDNVRIETRTSESDGGGGQTDDWSTLISRRRVSLTPQRGDEQVQAARLQGRALWDCWARWDSEMAAVTTDMRVVDNRDETRVWNIRFCEDMGVGFGDVKGQRRLLLLTLERGVA